MARWTAEDGATAVEYALMVTAIAAVIILAVFAVGNTTNESFCESTTALDTHGSGSTATC